jgi:hypothetical protein
MLVTALACLLFAAARANAGITVIVPVNVTNLHEEVTGGRVIVYFFDSGLPAEPEQNNLPELGHPGAVVGWGAIPLPITDHSCVKDLYVEVEQPEINAFIPATALYISQSAGDRDIFNATHYRISLRLLTAQDGGASIAQWCEPNYHENALAHCSQTAYAMQTYERHEGPISDLVPQ